MPREKITTDMCNALSQCGDMTGKVMAIRAEALRPEYRSTEHQLVYVVGGNGTRPQSFGTACHCITLYSGERERWERHDFQGEVKPDCLPQWAKEKKAEMEQRRTGRQIQKTDREVR